MRNVKGRSTHFRDKIHVQKQKKSRHPSQKKKRYLSNGMDSVRKKNPTESHVNLHSKNKREQIIHKAIGLFSKNGFHDTTIADITETLGIGKGTFYLYFKDKRDLIIDCIGQLTTIAVPKEVWEDIRNDTDFFSRQEKRLGAFLKSFPTFCGILNLLKSCLQSNDPELIKKATDTYRMLIDPSRKDMRWAIEHGVISKVDEEVVSSIMFGMGESAGYLLMIDPRYTLEYVAKIVTNLVRRNLLSQTETPKQSNTNRCYWEGTDRKAQKFLLRNIRFDGKDYVGGILGSGEYRIPAANFVSMELYQEDSQLLATFSGEKGEKITLKIDEDMSLSGESQFGQYTIRMEDLEGIILTGQDDISGHRPEVKDGLNPETARK